MPVAYAPDQLPFLFELAQRAHARARAAAALPPVGSIAPSVWDHWQPWLTHHFAPAVASPMAPRMVGLWDWFDAIRAGERPRSRLECWPRGGGKSASVELGVARLGARLARRFVLYLSATQYQADKHVESIGALMERLGSERAVNQYGQSRGWRHNELHTAGGFTVLALGLDVASRGIKIDQYRPDLLVLDDIDDRLDSPPARDKKTITLTQSILPARAAEGAVLFVQNLIATDSIMAQLLDGTADFLLDRVVGAREPAVEGLQVEHDRTEDGLRYRITAGTPTWAGQDLAACEQAMVDWGLAAFLREAQHEVDEVDGGLWSKDELEALRVVDHPPLLRVAVGIDPSISSTGDEAGIVAAGLGSDGHAYVLADATLRGPPQQWAGAAVALYNRLRAQRLVAEANQGGEMVALTIGTIPGAPRVALIHANIGKTARAEPIHKLTQDGRVHHVGYFPALEAELRTWKLGMPSPNRMDAYVHVLTDLLIGPSTQGARQPKNATQRGAGAAWVNRRSA